MDPVPRLTLLQASRVLEVGGLDVRHGSTDPGALALVRLYHNLPRPLSSPLSSLDCTCTAGSGGNRD